MSLTFRKAGTTPAREVSLEQVPPLVEGLRRWIGASRLVVEIDRYRKKKANADGIGMVRLGEHQAVLAGFEDYRKQTLAGQRSLRTLSRELAVLTNVAGYCQTIAPREQARRLGCQLAAVRVSSLECATAESQHIQRPQRPRRDRWLSRYRPGWKDDC